MSELHSLIRITRTEETKMPERCLFPTYISTRRTQLLNPTVQNYISDPHNLPPINSMTVQTFFDSHVDHANVETKLELTMDPLHTEVTDQFSAVTFRKDLQDAIPPQSVTFHGYQPVYLCNFVCRRIRAFHLYCVVNDCNY